MTATRGVTPLQVISGLSLAFWIYYAFLRQVAGPLNPDEIYFSHTLWLINQGKRQYIDFQSHHLPFYFDLLKPLVSALSRSPTDLSFLWGLRALSALIISMYLVLAWCLKHSALAQAGRAGLFGTWALLLMFVVLARMVELRTDTFGLLLINAAWATVLCSRSRWRLLAAAALAAPAILFSARGAAMVGVMGLLLLYLGARHRDRTVVLGLLAIGVLFLGAGLTACLVAPEWVTLVFRSCFLEPAALAKGLSMAERFLALERVALTFLIGGGLAAGVWLVRLGETEQGVVVATACAAQLLMVALDPAPYEYVYGWAAIPAVLGLMRVGAVPATLFSAGLAAAVLGISLAYTVHAGQAPRTLSYFRLTFDKPLSESDIARLPTPALVGLLISDDRQKNFSNQLRIRSEVCRRLQGPVLATFDTHPICLHDAAFSWTDVRWLSIAQGDHSPAGSPPPESFAQMLITTRPKAFIWDRRWGPHRALLPSTRAVLACCYEVHRGFALATGDPQDASMAR